MDVINIYLNVPERVLDEANTVEKKIINGCGTSCNLIHITTMG